MYMYVCTCMCVTATERAIPDSTLCYVQLTMIEFPCFAIFYVNIKPESTNYNTDR